jgi:HEAT repeat protein
VLKEVLQSGNLSQRADAATALGRIGPDAAPAVPLLVKALGDPAWKLKAAAIDAVRGIGPAAAEAVVAIVPIMKEGGPDIRADAARALQALGPAAKEAVPVLIDALADNTPFVRRESAIALGRIGPDARAALPALGKMLQDSDTSNAVEPAAAIWLIGRDNQPLLELLGKKKESELWSFRNVLGRIGPSEPWIVSSLVEILSKGQADNAAGAILGDFGPAAESAAPVLEKRITAVGRWSPEGQGLMTSLAKIDPERAAAFDAPSYAGWAIAGGALALLAAARFYWKRRRSSRSPTLAPS